MKYDSEVGVVRTSRRLRLVAVGVSDWMGFWGQALDKSVER